MELPNRPCLLAFCAKEPRFEEAFRAELRALGAPLFAFGPGSGTVFGADDEPRDIGAQPELWRIYGAGGAALTVVLLDEKQRIRLRRNAPEAEGTLLTHAGPEIGVASTKAFTSQLVALALLALHLGRLRGTLSPERCRELLQSLSKVPHLMENALQASGRIDEMSKFFAHAHDFLFLGRGINYPIALEGALKLKEISYIHAEGYPAGEMKHGPIALIDENMPVVALCPPGRTYEKMLSNVQEVKARGGKVLAITMQGDTEVPKILEQPPDMVVDVPEVDEVWSPLLTVLPLQLLAYHTAVRAGRDVDQPRNLAKSVTVE